VKSFLAKPLCDHLRDLTAPSRQQGKTQREAKHEKAGYELILSAPETPPELRSHPAQLYKTH